MPIFTVYIPGACSDLDLCRYFGCEQYLCPPGCFYGINNAKDTHSLSLIYNLAKDQRRELKDNLYSKYWKIKGDLYSNIV